METESRSWEPLKSVCAFFPTRPEIEPFLIRLIEQIRDDDVDGQASGFKLLSALFVLVDGELSRTRLLSANHLSTEDWRPCRRLH